MEGGRGFVSYGDQTSYPISAHRTTEFEDELLKRKIVNRHQVYLSKGATERQAIELEREYEEAKKQNENSGALVEESTTAKASSSFESDEEEDAYLLEGSDEIMQQCWQERITKQYATMKRISRAEWKAEVNECTISNGQMWVVICLTWRGRTEAVEEACSTLAKQQDPSYTIKFVSIDAAEAIPDAEWHTKSLTLPALLLYRRGELQHSCWNLPVRMQVSELQNLLQQYGVL